MKASLPIREPQILKFWEENRIYKLILEHGKGKPKKVLHDGPPYSNGKIHLGHAINKIVKDIVTKYWTLTGYDSPYVPGWDTHGLPNELEAIKTFKLDRKSIHPLELRKKCRESALLFVDIQREQFKRLGIIGDWDNPYLTLNPVYEAAIVDVFAIMAQKGYIYRGKKTVHWCYTCETALAEAEIEYKEKESPSIYVKFRIKKGKLLDRLREGINLALQEYRKNPAPDTPIERFEKAKASLDRENPYVIIWTTTPWTLPGNVAIALHPNEEYCAAVASNGEVYFLAEKLIPSVEKAVGLKLDAIAGLIGKDAAVDTVTAHPFLDRESVLICQDYVTMDEGTGAVHTAPGHGQEDFEAAKHYNLPILVPVDGRGVLTEEAGPFAGIHIEKANKVIPDALKESGALLAAGTLRHSYPHCWRCHKPVIFRATEQWFVAVDHHDLRKHAIQSVKKIRWVPSWGEERMGNTVEQRPDWCISRQRVWGVPLPVFYCVACKKPVITKESTDSVKRHFLEEGSDAWYSRPSQELLPQGFVCPHCDSSQGFEKEMDIFDVWFESGASHHAVLQNRPELSWPSQLYLEGPDQYRGWFQSSLLTAMAVKGTPPYHEVLTNGWTLDLDGRAMHKSLGNVIDPMDVIKEHGADILRLFFSSVDFKNDFRIGDKVLKDVGESYRKIRNTCRFLLGNLSDFHPEKDHVKDSELHEIDRWALMKLYDLMEKVQKAYENYDFHLVYYHVLNFCVIDMSAFYFDIMKDKLYTYASDSKERRSAQTALHKILMSLVKMLYPILSFTAEEIWMALPIEFKDSVSVSLTHWPLLSEQYKADESFRKRWDKLLSLRERVYLSLEEARQQKLIRQPLEAEVELLLPETEARIFSKDSALLKDLFIVSDLTVREDQNLIEPDVRVKPSTAKKCARCWQYRKDFSTDPAHPDICSRCLHVLEKISVS